MSGLRKLRRLPPERRDLLFRAAALTGAIRVGLTVLPFRSLQAVAGRAGRRREGAPPAGRASVTEVAWAVASASRYVPKATCLVQALALQVLLARRGYDARVVIGVARSDAGRLDAHAWVECEGRTFLGGAASGGFTPLDRPFRERRGG